MIFFGGAASRGHGSHRTSSSQGSNVEVTVTISLEEVYTGTTKEITVSRYDECEGCNGTGSKDKNAFTTCSVCKGSGFVRFSQGFFSVQQDCNECHGSGKVIKHPCSKCHGNGITKTNKKLQVKIPEGIDKDAVLRMTNEGNAGIGKGSRGDLYIHVSVLKHKFYRREAKDLHCDIHIDLMTAVLGGEVDVPTLANKCIKLKVKAGVQSNTALRVKGKGVRAVGSSAYGDLYCHIVVETPINLSKEQLSLFKQIKDSVSLKKQSPKFNQFQDYVKSITK